jgi:hypothetical protein
VIFAAPAFFPLPPLEAVKLAGWPADIAANHKQLVRTGF